LGSAHDLDLGRAVGRAPGEARAAERGEDGLDDHEAAGIVQRSPHDLRHRYASVKIAEGYL
jgi:hypothetical protein